MNRKNRTIGFAFILVSVLIGTATAVTYFYEQALQTATQTIKDVADITVKTPVALTNIDEGQPATYTKTEIADLGAAATVVTYKSPVDLTFSSTDLGLLSTYYTTYTITVKIFSVPGGSTLTPGSTAATLTLTSTSPAAITLDAAGTYVFDYEITVLAKSGIATDTPTTATITVSALPT